MDNTKKTKFLPLPGIELLPFSYLACSQSLYWLSYPGSFNWLGIVDISDIPEGSKHSYIYKSIRVGTKDVFCFKENEIKEILEIVLLFV
jgi:hypothetical protein